MGVTPQRGCPRFKTAINTNAEELQHINTVIYVAKEYLKKAKDSNKQLKKIFDEAATNLEQFGIEIPNKTRESLMGHAKQILQPPRDYYNNLFHE